MTDASGLARWRGIVGLAARRAVTRAVRTERGQTALTVAGVAAAVALMLVVTSVGVGLAGASTFRGEGVDYTIVPEGGASSTVMDVRGAQLGQVHGVSERLNAREDVAFATPVRTELVRVRAGSGEPEYVLLVGIVPPAAPRTVVGLPTDPLTPGDPHFANGSYNGTWTGEAVLSEAAAGVLDASPGESLVPVGAAGEGRPFTVVNVSAARSAGLGQFPVAIVHLAELQAVTGGTASDAADQIIVDGRGDIEGELAALYPRSTVLTRADLFGGGSTGASKLPLAISAAAFAVAVVVGALFMMTTMGFEIAAESRERAVMAALGVSRRTRVALVAVEALAIAALGGLVGIVLWLVGIVVTNAAVGAFLADVPIAAFRPVFAVYGLGVALLIGLLTLPYLLVLSRRTVSTESLQG